LPKEFWAKAINVTCYVVNLAPSITINLKIPEEEWLGEKVNYSRLKIFGCLAYALVDGSKRSKLDAKSK